MRLRPLFSSLFHIHLQTFRLNQVKHYSFAHKRVYDKMDRLIKSRDDPVIMKLDSKEFKSIFTEELHRLKEIFDKYGYEIRLAGGPVRDLLMGIQPKDLDFATTATPQEMKEMFIKENVRMINVNGEKHGTITPRINDKENYEITTLRIDMVTDGRHADVQFTSDWRLDANRRDLTINSMFLGFDGSVYDYFYGYDDLMVKRVCFVGDADTRIKEDFLRILRYFRFYGRIANEPNKHEEETLNSIEKNVEGLKIISGERIWVELKKILSGNFAGDLLKTMLELNLGKYMGLPENINFDELERVWNVIKHVEYEPVTLLCSVLNNIDDVIILNERLKFSSFDRDLTYFIVDHRNNKPSTDPMLPYQKLIINSKAKHIISRKYVSEVLKYKDDLVLLKKMEDWIIPKFPYISVEFLNKNGVTVPKLYSQVINGLKDYWMNNHFDVDMEEFEKQIPIIMKNIENHLLERPKKIKNRKNV